MSRIPFSEFTESELRIVIISLEHYVKDMPEEAKIYDTCMSLLGEMKFNLKSRLTKRAVDGAGLCACGLGLLPDGTCPMHFQYITHRN